MSLWLHPCLSVYNAQSNSLSCARGDDYLTLRCLTPHTPCCQQQKCSNRGVSYQLGLIIFNIGLGSGLTKLGTIVGANLPGLCAGHALGAHACEYVDATYLGVCRHLSSTDTPDSCLRQNPRSGRLAFVHAGSRHGAGVCLCLGPGIRCDAGGAGALYPCHYCRKADSWPPVQAAGAGACHAYVSYAHLGMYV